MSRSKDKKKRRTYRERIYEENSKEVADKLWEEYRKKISQNKEAFIRRYGKKEGLKRYEIFKKKSKHTKEKYIKQFGEKEGSKKWDQYILKKKQTSKRSIEYWLIKTDGDYKLSKELQSDYQIRDKKFFLNKYGEKEGLKRYEKRCNKHKNAMLKHFKDESNRKKRSSNKEAFIRRYGKKEGLKKWKEANSKKGLTLQNFKRKYGDVIGEQKYKEYKIKQKQYLLRRLHYSSSSQELFNAIIEKINNFNETKIYFATHNKEYFLNKNNKLFFYDFTMITKNKKKIIEFNGDFWHANPKIFEENYYHNIMKKTAKEIWEQDKIKINTAKKEGFDILIIWEKEWNSNKKKTINKCLTFLKD